MQPGGGSMKWIMVLWFCGVVVGPAMAGDRWPVAACKELAQLRGIVESSGSVVAKINQRFALLILQGGHCGLITQPLVDADIATLARLEKRHADAPARQPLNCTTIKLSNDMTSTNCN